MYLFLQVADLPSKILDQPGDTIGSKIVFAVLVAILLGIGVFIMYLTKAVLAPAIKEMVASMVKGADAVVSLKDELIVSNNTLKEVITQGDNKILSSVEAAKDQIIDEVRDEKIRQLALQLQNK